MKKLITATFICTLFTGCASIMDDSTQSINVMPMHKGEITRDTTCRLSNSKGNWIASGGSSVIVKKSGRDMNIDCHNHDKSLFGNQQAPKSTQWGYAVANFFIWDLCTISCLIDFTSGSIYEYPNQVIVPMQENKNISLLGNNL